MQENLEAVVEEQPAAEAEVQEQPVVQEPAVQAPVVKEKKTRKKRSVGVRILMGFVAFLLCIVMFATALVGVLLLDLRAVVSRDGINEILNHLVFSERADIRSHRMSPALAAVPGRGMIYRDNMDISQITGDIPQDVLDSVVGSEGTAGGMSGALIDWAYDMVKEQMGEEMPITKEQIQEFVEESTVKDFVTDKVAGIVEDFYNGESNTTITAEEIKDLIEENKEVIQEHFGVEITEEQLDMVDQAIEESGVLKPIEKEGLLGYIEQSMTGVDSGSGNLGGGDTPLIDESLKETMEMTKQIMDAVRTVTSYETIIGVGVALLVMVLLLFFVTGRSIPATLADTGIVLTLASSIFAIPSMICLGNPQIWQEVLGDEMISGITTMVFKATANVNYTVLAVGAGMIVAAIVVKIVQSVLAKKAA